jgi:hypothetical protein
MTHFRRSSTRCPRDRGRLFLQEDHCGAYLSCLSCGALFEVQPPATHEPAVPPAQWWHTQSA